MKLPKSSKVRKRREYLNFFKKSEVKKLGVCVVFRVHNSLEKARLGITVKGKSNSVLRNKVKRQIREVFRLNQNKLGHFDYNVVVSGTVRVDYQTAEQVKRALEKIWSHEVIF